MKLRNLSLVAVALLAYATPSAKAGFIDTVQNGLNIYHDQSFEFVNMSQPTHGLQIGDTIIGLNQINTRQFPGNASTFNTIYALTSETITGFSSDGTLISLGPTPTTSAFSLQTILTGLGLTIPDGTLTALFDKPQSSPFGSNLIAAPPSGATNMQGYLQYVANKALSGSTYEFAAGFTAGDNSFLTVNLGKIGSPPVQLVANDTFAGVPATENVFNTTPNSISIGGFNGGLSVLLNNTPNVIFNTLVPGNDGNLHQIVIRNGAASGGNNDTNYAIWGTPGFEDSADFLLNATVVPEPTSILLMALGMSGLVGVGYRRRKKADL